jgi:NhaA family Na+:H+ antiporter
MLGIWFGLLVGKLIGVFGTTFLAVKFKLAPMPNASTWVQVFGIALVCGVGFTMSFFVGTLAYPEGISAEPYDAWVRLGVIFGSLSSGFLGYLVLRWATKKAA